MVFFRTGWSSLRFGLKTVFVRMLVFGFHFRIMDLTHFGFSLPGYQWILKQSYTSKFRGKAPFGKPIQTGGECILFGGKIILGYLLIINYLVNVRCLIALAYRRVTASVAVITDCRN